MKEKNEQEYPQLKRTTRCNNDEDGKWGGITRKNTTKTQKLQYADKFEKVKERKELREE